MKQVLINILNYNTFENSCVCIDSCLKQADCDCSILLIDNKSTDDSFFKLKEKYADRINYLQNDSNYGFAKGNNIGVEYSYKVGYKYTLMLNSDTELIGEHLVRDLSNALEENSLCSVISPIIYDVTKNGNKIHTNDSLYLWYLRLLGILPKNKTISHSLQMVSEAHGSALMVRNDHFLRVGGFPEHYFMYGEESTLSKKILWDGKLLLMNTCSSSYILHHHDKTGFVAPWRLYLMGRNRSLEYYENRKKFPLWRIVYVIFYLITKIKNRSNDKHILNGMIEGKRLYKSDTSKQEIYELGKEVKERYI